MGFLYLHNRCCCILHDALTADIGADVSGVIHGVGVNHIVLFLICILQGHPLAAICFHCHKALGGITAIFGQLLQLLCGKGGVLPGSLRIGDFLYVVVILVHATGLVHARLGIVGADLYIQGFLIIEIAETNLI